MLLSYPCYAYLLLSLESPSWSGNQLDFSNPFITGEYIINLHCHNWAACWSICHVAKFWVQMVEKIYVCLLRNDNVWTLVNALLNLSHASEICPKILLFEVWTSFWIWCTRDGGHKFVMNFCTTSFQGNMFLEIMSLFFALFFSVWGNNHITTCER